jgi:hypothetical protein
VPRHRRAGACTEGNEARRQGLGRLLEMSISLRDLFAAHVAASLATRVDTADAIAAKSYDLAEALLRERSKRQETEVRLPLAYQGAVDDEPSWLDFELGARGSALLDEPAPVSERDDEPDARWLEREERDPNSYDPRWEATPVVTAPSVRPGLARTAPAEEAAPRKEKIA